MSTTPETRRVLGLLRESRETLTDIRSHVLAGDHDDADLVECLNVLDGNSALIRELLDLDH